MSGPTPVDSQILAALRALVLAANTDAGQKVDIERTEDDPYEADGDLPAINLLLVEESIRTPSTMGMVASGADHDHRLNVVVQVVATGGTAGSQARAISAQVAQALGTSPTLGGLLSGAILPIGKQWLRDDAGESRLMRQNNLWACSYRTHSHNPFDAI